MGRSGAVRRGAGLTACAVAAAKAGPAFAPAPAAADDGPWVLSDFVQSSAGTTYIESVEIGSVADDGILFKPGAGGGCTNGSWPVWISEETGPPNYAFTPYFSLGGCVSGLDYGYNSDGRIEFFGLGVNGAIYHDWQIRASGTAPWSGWQSLGYVGSGFKGGPSVESPGISGTYMKVHAMDASGNWWVDQRPNSSWTGWSEL